jgi:polysaccharide biosynthesis protein PslJ
VDPQPPNTGTALGATTRPAPTRRAKSSFNLRLLTTLIVVLVAIPSILIIGPLGSAGTPADVIGLVMLVMWVFARITVPPKPPRANPVRIAMLLFVAAVMASYIAAATRPISTIEQSAADRGVLLSVAWLGMLLFTIDGPRTLGELEVLLRRLTYVGAAEALVGLAQFATKLALVNYIQIPGLSVNGDLSSLSDRGDLTRPPGTTIHPIEFGAVLTMILPIALHFALTDRHRRPIARWFPVAAIALAVPISISRSAILSGAVALLFLLPTWSPQIRRRVYVGLVVLFGAIYLVVHGLLSELTDLFLGISSDTSAASRTGSFGLAMQFISRSPFFGRGFRTFLPEYRILDDQLLGTAVEMGIIGLVVLLGLMLTSLTAAIRVRRASRDPIVRDLGQTLAASIAAGSCSFALYDALSFPMAASVFFIVLGATGGLVRFSRQPAPDSVSAAGAVAS